MKQIWCKPTSEITDKDLEGFCFCTDGYCGGRPCVSYQFIHVRSMTKEELERLLSLGAPDDTAHLLSTEANRERLAASIAQLEDADRKPSQRDLRDTAVRLTTNGCWCDECEAIEADIERLAEEQGHDVALMHALTLAEQGRRGRLEQLRHRIRDVGVYRAWVSWWRIRSIARKLRRMNREGDQ